MPFISVQTAQAATTLPSPFEYIQSNPAGVAAKSNNIGIAFEADNETEARVRDEKDCSGAEEVIRGKKGLADPTLFEILCLAYYATYAGYGPVNFPDATYTRAGDKGISATVAKVSGPMRELAVELAKFYADPASTTYFTADSNGLPVMSGEDAKTRWKTLIGTGGGDSAISDANTMIELYLNAISNLNKYHGPAADRGSLPTQSASYEFESGDLNVGYQFSTQCILGGSWDNKLGKIAKEFKQTSCDGDFGLSFDSISKIQSATSMNKLSFHDGVFKVPYTRWGLKVNILNPPLFIPIYTQLENSYVDGRGGGLWDKSVQNVNIATAQQLSDGQKLELKLFVPTVSATGVIAENPSKISSIVQFAAAYKKLAYDARQTIVFGTGATASTLQDAAKRAGLVVEPVISADTEIEDLAAPSRANCGKNPGWDIGLMIPYSFCVIVDITRTWVANFVVASGTVLSKTSGIDYDSTISELSVANTNGSYFDDRSGTGNAFGDWLGGQIEDAKLDAAGLPEYLRSPLVVSISSLALNLVGMAVLLTFLVIGFASVLRIQPDAYSVQKLLPNAVLGYLVAFLGVPAVRVLVEASDYLASAVFGVSLAGNNGPSLSIEVFVSTILGLTDEKSAKLITSAGDFDYGLIFQQIIVNGLMFAAAVMLFILAFLFLLRNVIFIPLAALAPLAFFGLFFPQLKSVWDRWWKTTQGWAFMNVVAGFWIWLGFQFMIAARSAGGLSGGLSPAGFVGGNTSTLVGFVIGIFCIYQAMRTPFSMAGEAAKLLQGWEKMGKQAWGATGGAVGKMAGQEANIRWNRSAAGRMVTNTKQFLKRGDEEREAELKATREGKSLRNARKDAGKLTELTKTNKKIADVEAAIAEAKAKGDKGEEGRLKAELIKLRSVAMLQRGTLTGTSRNALAMAKRDIRKKTQDDLAAKADSLVKSVGELQSVSGTDRGLAGIGARKARNSKVLLSSVESAGSINQSLATIQFESSLTSDQRRQVYENKRLDQSVKSDAEDKIADNQMEVDLEIMRAYKKTKDRTQKKIAKSAGKAVKKAIKLSAKDLEKEIKADPDALNETGILIAQMKNGPKDGPQIVTADDGRAASNFLRGIETMRKLDYSEMGEAIKLCNVMANNIEDPVLAGRWKAFLADLERPGIKEELTPTGNKGIKNTVRKDYEALLKDTKFIPELQKLKNELFVGASKP
jgi:hypothetical protein